MTDDNEHWTLAIKKAIGEQIATIIDEETAAASAAASERVRNRISETKQAIIDRAVDRIKVIQKHSLEATLRYEVIIQL